LVFCCSGSFTPGEKHKLVAVVAAAVAGRKEARKQGRKEGGKKENNLS
jgi:hypothetical protein